jgi:fumarate reductase subunit D
MQSQVGDARWVMRDLDKALADIFAIRSQIAAGTAFRGYGPEAMAATGALALLTAVFQFLWLDNPTAEPLIFFGGWAVTALVCCGIIWVEMQARSRRHHSGLADAMIHQAVEQFLPAGVAGVLLAVMLGRFAPETLWMLPGLWQLLTSLGIFASARSLPSSIKIAAAWYFVAGFAVLVAASVHHTLSPWTMGLPFVIGQFLMAAILHFASGENYGED